MSSLVQEDRIPPVWERLPQVFAYPFHPTCLASLVLYAFIYGLGFFLPFIGLLLALVAYIGLYKFAADVLEATARGRMEPPEIQSSSTDWMLAKQFLLVVGLVVGVLGIAELTESLFFTVLSAMTAAMVLPAAIMIVVMTNSLLNALNPLNWYDVIHRIGWGYLVAVLLLMMLSFSQGVAENVVLSLAGYGFLGSITLFLVSGYFLIASFHLMGYLVYANHEDLGVDVVGDGVEKPGQSNSGASTPVLAQVESLLGQGDTDGAIACLRQNLNQGGLPEEHERYRKLLALQGRTDEMLAHAREYIDVLLYGHEDEKKAMLVMQESLRQDPKFRPKQTKTVLDLAQVLDRFQDHESVLRLTNGFANRHPKHPDVCENYYLAARALWFGRGEEKQALKILTQLQKRFPDHSKRPDIEKLARLIQGAKATTS